MKLQLQRMHTVFGRSYGNRCGDCCNFAKGRYHDRILQKCVAYGLTHSEASDWAQRWDACGQYNTPHDEKAIPIIKRGLFSRGTRAAKSEGQIGMFEEEDNGLV